ARAAGDLIITTTVTLRASRSRQERLVLVSRALYRGAFFALRAGGLAAEPHVRAVADRMVPESHRVRQRLTELGLASSCGKSRSNARTGRSCPTGLARPPSLCSSPTATSSPDRTGS